MKILEMVQQLRYQQACSGDVIVYKKQIVSGEAYPYVALIIDLKAQTIIKHLRVNGELEAISLPIERDEALLAIYVFEESEECDEKGE